MLITKRYITETAHRLVNYEGKCAHLHGHRYVWEVRVSGPVDNRGFLIDFKDLKKIIVEVLEPLDHAVVFHKDDPLARRELLDATNGSVGRVHIWDVNPTVENLAVYAYRAIDVHLAGRNDTLKLDSIKVWETEDSFAEYRP